MNQYKRNKKVEVSVKKERIECFDFGMFPKSMADTTIKVDMNLWHDYVQARERYDIIHEELIKCAKKVSKKL